MGMLSLLIFSSAISLAIVFFAGMVTVSLYRERRHKLHEDCGECDEMVKRVKAKEQKVLTQRMEDF